MKGKLDFQPKLFTALQTYTKDKFLKDLMAGIIVGIVALPLAIAFGIASGVSPEKGLITAIIGGFIVSFLGGSNVQIGGPTGAFIVIVYGIIQNFGIEGLAIATVMAGIMLVILGVLKLGTIIKFIPYPIVVGFTSGIAVTIFTTQMKDLFGLDIDKVPADFISKWIVYFQHIQTVKLWPLLIGIVSLLIIVYSPKITKKIPGSLIAIVLMTVISYLMRHFLDIHTLETIGDRFTINASLPQPESISFNMETINRLLPSAFTIAILGAIESLLSATVADGVTGDKHNSNTELIAQGAANIIVPIFGGIPVTGAIARTMTNINNGGRTPVAGIIHAIVLLLILLFLGPLTQHIPMACLAGVLIIVSYNMSEWRTFRSLLKGPKSDVYVLLVTFFLTVIFDLTIAIEIGLLIAMFLFMRRVTETTSVSVVRDVIDLSNESEIAPEDEKLSVPDGVEVYEIDGPFFFGVANKFDGVMQTLGDKPSTRIIRMRKVPFMDSTGLHNLESLLRLSKAENIHLILSGVNEDVRKVLKKAGFDQQIGPENICRNIHEALERAQTFVSKEDNE
ncbi:SulP family sulfate permease [Parabacteroides sp. PF5-5]|uniref:SulP family inorganic anion transporter n=1 Tax=unclassified Parabacteroides TaxID=2649774 RepID=UPI002476BABB|nr:MULTISPECIES: sulfate permease [unclassified Parabacteroides]MDH6305004.1 SulP family sulfate permease [Parabacteroides sp. PH5-39]MDH6315911.1 SulP family sulfate permease [Parabacteroides sp. PF5-13]MDH6319568.1 SulP family sulfate permease [Parabacteroides sp. PH5-13]MDH6323299.1 SulP family sulfate permease [Parabacteroides sp. PH5-8]MDH6327193.1 SulP family sulfate permease [Parabacteroides sp. PH5-41]